MALKRPACAAIPDAVLIVADRHLSHLPAGVWGVRCCLGPRNSGGAPINALWGTVLNPGLPWIVDEWCNLAASHEIADGRCPFVTRGVGPHDLGGWFIGRSAAVQWDGSDQVYFYKCGDEREYDLAWYVPDAMEFDTSVYLDVEMIFREYLAHHHPRAVEHIMECERHHRCGGLSRLLRGDTPRQVGIALRHRS
jgi:hypothetical protein